MPPPRARPGPAARADAKGTQPPPCPPPPPPSQQHGAAEGPQLPPPRRFRNEARGSRAAARGPPADPRPPAREKREVPQLGGEVCVGGGGGREGPAAPAPPVNKSPCGGARDALAARGAAPSPGPRAPSPGGRRSTKRLRRELPESPPPTRALPPVPPRPPPLLPPLPFPSWAWAASRAPAPPPRPLPHVRLCSGAASSPRSRAGHGANFPGRAFPPRAVRAEPPPAPTPGRRCHCAAHAALPYPSRGLGRSPRHPGPARRPGPRARREEGGARRGRRDSLQRRAARTLFQISLIPAPPAPCASSGGAAPCALLLAPPAAHPHPLLPPRPLAAAPPATIAAASEPPARPPLPPRCLPGLAPRAGWPPPPHNRIENKVLPSAAPPNRRPRPPPPPAAACCDSSTHQACTEPAARPACPRCTGTAAAAANFVSAVPLGPGRGGGAGCPPHRTAPRRAPAGGWRCRAHPACAGDGEGEGRREGGRHGVGDAHGGPALTGGPGEAWPRGAGRAGPARCHRPAKLRAVGKAGMPRPSRPGCVRGPTRSSGMEGVVPHVAALVRGKLLRLDLVERQDRKPESRGCEWERCGKATSSSSIPGRRFRMGIPPETDGPQVGMPEATLVSGRWHPPSWAGSLRAGPGS
ncbi:basic proline-rich protein-like [Corvus hawaiiensis]|uniref:basic proline-rich protein-like n=1 Tax=Corvus hawaiiensis TaxID=134902 RepID=UPI0020192D46|nr:basic proline-rich protein-like [Corvus hawaiiensis]